MRRLRPRSSGVPPVASATSSLSLALFVLVCLTTTAIVGAAFAPSSAALPAAAFVRSTTTTTTATTRRPRLPWTPTAPRPTRAARMRLAPPPQRMRDDGGGDDDDDDSRRRYPWEELPSAYDRILPATLRGEAVRAALRSDRGICFDFTTDRYGARRGDAAEGVGRAPSSASAAVEVVRVRGEGTRSFLDAKFSASARLPPARSPPKSRLEPFRTGGIYETVYLTRKGRTVDRLVVLTLPGDDGSVEEALLITSPCYAVPGGWGGRSRSRSRTRTRGGSSSLFDQLAPFVFPMDQIALTDLMSGDGNEENANRSVSVVTLACASIEDARASFRNNVLPFFFPDGDGDGGDAFKFPLGGTCHHYRVPTGGSGNGGIARAADVYLFETSFLPAEVCGGYTLLVAEEESLSSSSPPPSLQLLLADRIWEHLTSESNDVYGPVGVGPLEYETLRIEGGGPGRGYEMTGDGKRKKKKGKGKEEDLDNDREEDKDEGGYGGDESDMTYVAPPTRVGPLELHLAELVDESKGCYQGQEGVAAMSNNKRGLSRSLYSVAFRDDENDFGGNGDDGGYGFGLDDDDDDDDDALDQLDKIDALTNGDSSSCDSGTISRYPRPGDDLYVLGSSESIKVGTVTSVAEPGGTGDAETIALALVRRSKPILDAAAKMGLDPPTWLDDEDDKDGRGGSRNGGYGGGDAGYGNDDGPSSVAGGESVMMRPPPLDALHNLEVIVGGTGAVGRLKSVPSRRYGSKNLLDYEGTGAVVDPENDNDGPGGVFRSQLEDVEEDEKRRRLIRDEEARRAASTDDEAVVDGKRGGDDELEDDDDDIGKSLAVAQMEVKHAAAAANTAAAEAKRKVEKLEMLKARAEAAVAARLAKSKEKEEMDAKKKEEPGKDTADSEGKRKAKKMEMLKERAEAAMAARRKKRELK